LRPFFLNLSPTTDSGPAPPQKKHALNGKAEGEAGFFTICRAATGAEFKITLTWKNEGKK
jgi:hypothetical protein